MLSRAQQILLKRAQRQAGIEDAEYRETLQRFAACESSRDSRFSDESLDTILAYFEAIYWRGVDADILQAPCRGDEVFQQRGFWASKNTRAETSRDRYNVAVLSAKIGALESQLERLGCGRSYCQAIREKVTQGGATALCLNHYRAALERTLKSKRKAAVEQPL